MFTLHITLLVHTLGKPADVFRKDSMRAIDFRVNKDLTDVALGRSYAVQCSVFIATNIQDRQPRRVLYFVYRINILLASYGNKFCYPLLFLMFFSTYFFLSFFLYSFISFSSLFLFSIFLIDFVLHFSISLTLRRLMSYLYGAPILDVSRSHTTTHHSR